MYSVHYGVGISIGAHDFPTAREALAKAEQYDAADRPHVVITNTASKRPVALDELRELAEQEAQAEVDGPLPPAAMT
jgi:hypothetical protein